MLRSFLAAAGLAAGIFLGVEYTGGGPLGRAVVDDEAAQIFGGCAAYCGTATCSLCGKKCGAKCCPAVKKGCMFNITSSANNKSFCSSQCCGVGICGHSCGVFAITVVCSGS
jgi:hypothetical protein